MAKLAAKEMTEAQKALAEIEEEEKAEETPKSSAEAQEFVQTYLQEHGISTEDMTPKEALARAKRLQKARERASQVLSRGRTLDQIDLALSRVPTGQRGQLVRERASDIARYQALGYEVFLDEESSRAAPSSAGDDRVRVADSIVMVIDEDEYIAIERERMVRRAKKKARTDAKAMAFAQRDKLIQNQAPIIKEM